MPEQSTSTLKTVVQAEANQHYACESCPAKCCRFPWKIAATPEEYARYHATPWIRELLEKEQTDLVPVGDHYKMPRAQKSDGSYACVFLDDENRCMIQLREGHEAIPKTCQLYPFSFIAEGDDTVYPVTSFFCKSILYNYGQSLDEISEPKYQAAKNAHKVQQFPETLTLGGVELPKKVYQALFERLENDVKNPEMSAAQALVKGRKLLTALVLSGHQAAGIDEVWFEKTCREFEQSAEATISLTAAGNTMTGNTVVAIAMLPFFSEVITQQYAGQNLQLRLQSFRLFLDLVRQQGRHAFWDLPGSIDLRAARKVTVPEPAPEMQAHLKRYFAHLFQNRQAFCDGEDLLKKYFLLGAAYAAILRVARYIAYASQRPQATLEDVMEATGYIDATILSGGRAETDMLSSLKTMIFGLLSAQEGSFERVLLTESGT